MNPMSHRQAQRAGYNPELVRKEDQRRTTQTALEKTRVKAEKARQAEKRFREYLQEQARLAGVPLPAKLDLRKPIIEIQQEVAQAHGITVADLVGRRAQREFTKPRQIAMAMAAAERPDLSRAQIGQRFGGRDQTTVKHAERVCKERGWL